MKSKKQQEQTPAPTTAVDHLRAVLKALDRNERWSNKLNAAEKAAQQFLNEKGNTR
jgi:hypothetical protein